MVRLAGERRTIDEEVLGGLRGRAEYIHRITTTHVDLRIRPGVVADQHAATRSKERCIEYEIHVDVFLRLHFDTEQCRLRRIREARDRRVVVECRKRFDGLVDLLVEARDREALLRCKVPLVAQLGVSELAIDQKRITAIGAVRLRVEVGLEHEFAELRARHRLRTVQAQLHVVAKLVGQGQRRQHVIVIEVRTRLRSRCDREDLQRCNGLFALFVTRTETELEAFGNLGLQLGVGRLSLE